ncbi:MAG TPA: heparinase II/III-family protein, partial [Blastocatellia bacterium]|nr:heparinase II/III-family protein [Blastocatellia bacterium]
MYHSIVLADFIECFVLLREWKKSRGLNWPDIEKINAKLQAMTRFLEAMTYADGTLALFNDSANENFARPLPIISSAHQICGESRKTASHNFTETGYYCWSSFDGSERIVVDAGPMSVDYNMAHAHCDLLSYEMWLQGKPFIVDSGVHGYGGDRFREYARSTRAHNTVMFDDHEQAELWGTFRVARRARVVYASAKGNESTWNFCGAYTPFYDSRVTHERQIRRESDGTWIITDTANNDSVSKASSFIHLHPDIQVKQNVSSQSIECSNESLSVLIEPFAAENVQVSKGSEHPIQGWYFPAFGVTQQSATIQFDYRVRAGQQFGYRIRKL